MSQVFKVEYADGTSGEVPIRPKGSMILQRKINAAEKKGEPEVGYVEAILTLIHGSLRDCPLEFDDFVDTVENITEVDTSSPDPTEPAAPAI